jgi:hypothetical protein
VADGACDMEIAEIEDPEPASSPAGL